MTDDDEGKTPLDHALDVVVYLPLGFMLDFPRSIPRYIARGRSQLDPSRLLGRSSTSPSFDPAKSIDRVKAQTRSTLRALGVVQAGDNGASATSAPSGSNGASAPGGIASSAAAPRPAPATPAEPAPPGGTSGIHPDSLAITDYDSLSASQVVPRLDSLAGEELENIRQYEAGTRGRKTISNKIALLQSS